jgi:hypothetical protein
MNCMNSMKSIWNLEVKLQLESIGTFAFDEMSIIYGALEDFPEGPSAEPRIPISRRPKIRLPLDH